MQSPLCHAIRCRTPLWSCRVTLCCTSGMQHCSEEPDNLDQGRGVLASDLWSQVPVWQILCGDTGMGEQSFLAAAFNSLEPTYFLKLAAFYILNPRIHATSIKIVYILSLIFLMMTIIYRLECPWQLAQL